MRANFVRRIYRHRWGSQPSVNCSKYGFALVRADRYEIHAGSSIVVVRQPNRLTIGVHGAGDFAERSDWLQFVKIRTSERDGKFGGRRLREAVARDVGTSKSAGASIALQPHSD